MDFRRFTQEYLIEKLKNEKDDMFGIESKYHYH